MKTLSALLLLIILTGCERRPVSTTTSIEKPEIEWNDAQYSIDEYKRMQPHRPILAVFTNKWDIPIVKSYLKKKEFMDILREQTFLCLNYESTDPDSIGRVEMKKLGHEAFPLAFVSIPNGGDSRYPLTYAEDELLAFVKKISKEAEQAGRGGGDYAKSKSQPRPPLDPPDIWKPLERKLADYVAAHPGRPILLSISARWSLVSNGAWKVLFSDEVTKALEPSGFLCLVGDVTEGNTLATGEINALGRSSVPVTAIYDPVDEAWHVQPDLFSAADVRKWISALQHKIAEQAAPPDGDKPSK